MTDTTAAKVLANAIDNGVEVYERIIKREQKALDDMLNAKILNVTEAPSHSELTHEVNMEKNKKLHNETLREITNEFISHFEEKKAQ